MTLDVLFFSFYVISRSNEPCAGLICLQHDLYCNRTSPCDVINRHLHLKNTVTRILEHICTSSATFEREEEQRGKVSFSFC